MNTGTPIFKIHKIRHFVTTCGKSILKYPIFMSKTTSLLKNMTEETDYCINKHSSSMTVVSFGQNVKTYPPLNANSC